MTVQNNNLPVGARNLTSEEWDSVENYFNNVKKANDYFVRGNRNAMELFIVQDRHRLLSAYNNAVAYVKLNYNKPHDEPEFLSFAFNKYLWPVMMDVITNPDYTFPVEADVIYTYIANNLSDKIKAIYDSL